MKTYHVKFVAITSLPQISWILQINRDSELHKITGKNYSINLPNGTYTYTVHIVNKTYLSPSYPGNFTVEGSNITKTITFLRSYSATFNETGLPHGTTWYINLTNSTGIPVLNSGSITGSSYYVNLINGTYSFTIHTVNKIYSPSFYSMRFTVDGKSKSYNVVFSKVTYKAIFNETGLPHGTTWYVNLTTPEETYAYAHNNSSENITFALTNGTYSYTISTPNNIYASSPSSNSFIIHGKNITEFVKLYKTYRITFKEKGLSNGTKWFVELNGTIKSSVTDTIYFNVINNTYKYIILNVSGNNASNNSGSVTVNGKDVLINNITFTKTIKTIKTENDTIYYVIALITMITIISLVITVVLKHRK